MNLIEQLGGYDKCKDLLLIPNIDMIMNAQGLREALLQHRRENNIFEVGDNVCCDRFNNLIKVLDIFEDRLVIDTGIKTTPDSKNTMAMALPMDMFRHSTDAEIKAGRRL